MFERRMKFGYNRPDPNQTYNAPIQQKINSLEKQLAYQRSLLTQAHDESRCTGETGNINKIDAFCHSLEIQIENLQRQLK